MTVFTHRRWLVYGAAITPLLLTACASTLRVAPHAELKVFDPVWTTAYITRNHGYLVYDTLFAMDANMEPRPQMVESWTESEDHLTWTFTLRKGLLWSDGTAVTADDCVASLQRWSKRDGVGQQLFRDVQSISATSPDSFTISLSVASGIMLETLAKMSANVPFMVPKRVAETDPFEPIRDLTGSGPFVYSAGESVSGSKTVYVKSPTYVARAEPLSLAAGGKKPQTDRIEWLYYPTSDAAVQALVDGKVDYVESPSGKLVEKLAGNDNIVVSSTDPLGNVAMVRFNMLQPPFDNVAVRRAVLKVMRQQDYMSAALGDEKYWRVCYSVFPCGTTYSTETERERLQATDLEDGKAALVAARYNGTPVVILDPVDNPVISAMTRVTADKLRAIGMNVEVQSLSWAELTERRASKAPANAGGWNMFHTWWMAADVADPTSIVFSGDAVAGWHGWLNDPELESYRIGFGRALTTQDRKAMAEKMQKRMVDVAAVGFLGQFFEPVAYSTRVRGITAPIQFYWNMSAR